MVKIHSSHLKAHKAVLAVCGVINEAGAIAEELNKDYGEDLIIQSHLRGHADSFRILMQVKSRSLKWDTRRESAIYIDVEHLLRWCSHIQPVIVCVYDDETGTIFYFNPKIYFGIWDLTTTNSKYRKITIKENMVFNKIVAERLIWMCRVDYYTTVLAIDSSRFEEVRYIGDDSSKRAQKIVQNSKAMVFTFLVDLGVITENGELDPKFVNYVLNASRSFAEMGESGKDLSVLDAFRLSLLGYVDSLFSGGLPGRLLNACADICHFIMTDAHRDVYDDIVGRFGRFKSRG